MQKPKFGLFQQLRIIPAYGHIDYDTPELAISVLPECRGQGIGTMLMNRLFELLRERGYKRTSLSVQRDNPAVRFYERLGYKVTDEKIDHAGHEDYIMVKELQILEITAATREELYEIAVFLDDCWRAEYIKIVSSDYLDAMKASDRYEKLLTRFDEKSSDFLVMRDLYGLVGAAVFGKSYTDGYPDDGEISAIYLRHDSIGKGRGHALFAKVEAALAAKEHDHFILDVLSDNIRAVSFYQKRGYKNVAERSVRLGEKDYPLIVFSKERLFQDIKSRITEPEVGKIISYAALDGSPEGVAKEAEKYLSSEKLNFYGWVENGKVVGICGFEVHTDKVEIHIISVAEDRQKQGIGGAMLTVLQKIYGLPLEAETVDEAVGFYRKRGFETTAFQHPEWGKKYICVLKMNHAPLL